MSKKREQRSVATLHNRPSGGGLAEVLEEPITVGLDKRINVDMSKLPAPSNSYDADFAWIEHRPGAVSLFFAKHNRDDGEKLRTRLELRYPPETFVGHFWRNSREFHQKLRDYVAMWPADETRSRLDPSRMKADREHSEWTNFDAIAHAGTEAVIDFYLLPASGVARFAKGHGSSGLRFTPIVRVQLTSFELVRLLDAATTVAEEVNRYLPLVDKRQLDAETKVEERA